MMIIGLTGGIATGKSTTATFFRERNIPVHDSDATVHQLMAAGGEATMAISAAFGPDVLDATGAVNRAALGGVVFSDPARRTTLEGILHPLVAADRDRFLQACRDDAAPMVVLDVPLLFETGGDALCDMVIVAAASDTTQRERTLQRPGMTAEKMTGILASQMPLAEKINRADFILDTEHGLDHARGALFAWLDGVTAARTTAFPARFDSEGQNNA